MSNTSNVQNPTFRSVLVALMVFAGLVIAFTIVGVLVGPTEALVGGTRPADTIPSHLEELAGVGATLGIGTAIFYGRRGLPFVFLATTLTVLLDLDHIPAYIGIAQPIRPAHSLVFIAFTLIIMAMVIRRLDVDLVVVSAIMGHMGVDSGLFPPFSPISFEYVQLEPYRIPLLLGAISVTILAGALVKTRPGAQTVDA